jgi:hypothetical protein
MTHKSMAPVLIAFGLLVAVCGCSRATPTVPPPTPTRPVIPTVGPEQRPSPTLAPLPTEAPATATPTAGLPALPAGGNCVNRYTYVSDVSFPDGTEVARAQAFTKTWRVRNSGTCTWGQGYVLVYVRGQAMANVSSIAVPTTAPGATADLSVPMTAPGTAGTYESFWALKTPGGYALTPNLWVNIVVP